MATATVRRGAAPRTTGPPRPTANPSTSMRLILLMLLQLLVVATNARLLAATADAPASLPPAQSIVTNNMPSSEGVQIVWSNLTFSVAQKKLLRNIYGEARPGRLLAVMGPSGCGKTTMINAIAGKASMTKQLPTTQPACAQSSPTLCMPSQTQAHLYEDSIKCERAYCGLFDVVHTGVLGRLDSMHLCHTVTLTVLILSIWNVSKSLNCSHLPPLSSHKQEQSLYKCLPGLPHSLTDTHLCAVHVFSCTRLLMHTTSHGHDFLCDRDGCVASGASRTWHA
eukprot:6195907-Pleurochrysis_carterae.AAC.1